MEIWLSKAVSFNPAIISESDRSIRGIATSPIFDRENELITQDAVAKALPYYMEVPVLTVNHTERPVGIVTKAEFDNEGRLLVEAKIGKSPACDDIWELVKSGVLNSFSISGRRRESDCKGDGQACVTKALWLDSITICAVPCNPEATFIVKGDTMTEEIKQEEVKKGETDMNAEVLSLMKSMGESISQLSAKVDSLTKSAEPDLEKCDKKDDKESEETMREKNVEKSIAEIAELVKAIDARLTVVENTKIEKAVVNIDDNGAPTNTEAPTMNHLSTSYAKFLYRGSKL